MIKSINNELELFHIIDKKSIMEIYFNIFSEDINKNKNYKNWNELLDSVDIALLILKIEKMYNIHISNKVANEVFMNKSPNYFFNRLKSVNIEKKINNLYI